MGRGALSVHVARGSEGRMCSLERHGTVFVLKLVGNDEHWLNASLILEILTLALMRLNVPTVASVCGHAAAGGLLLAMAHDHRLMRSDRGFLYCSAVDIGFVIPAASMALLKSKMQPKVFKDVVLKGVKYTASMALHAGLVDSVHAGPEETLAAALKEAEDLGSRGWNRGAYAALRGAMYDGVVERLVRDAAEDAEAVQDPRSVGFL